MDKTYIVGEIKRTAAANGGVPLGRGRFRADTGIVESDWQDKYWVRWSDAIKEAGVAPNRHQAAYDEEFLLRRLADLIRELGHFPISGELRLKARQTPGFPSHNTFTRFGGKELYGVASSYPGGTLEYRAQPK